MKNILMESTKSKFKVLEHKPKNVLKRIQGVLSDFKSNRNGRIYPRELWENVLNSDYVKEMIESHGLVGELDHPEERLEISLQNVSHVINDMWIEGDSVMGTIDILPTPSGKIVSELLDYGTDIGISSRGAGSVGAGNIVDPDYQFVTFDFVARPSCEAARLNMIVESVQPEIDTNSDDKVKSILEGYKSNLNENTNEYTNEYKGYEIVRFKGNDYFSIFSKIVVDTPNGDEEAREQLDTKDIFKKVQNNHYAYIVLDKIKDLFSLEFINSLNIAKIIIDAINGDINKNNYTEYLSKVTSESKDTRIEEGFNGMAGAANISNSLIDDTYMDRLKAIRNTLSDEDAEGLDMVLDYINCDPKTCALSTLEDEVHNAVWHYNEGNCEPEYEDEEFYQREYNANNIYTAIVKLFNRDKDIEKTDYNSLDESKGTYSSEAIAAFAISENFKGLDFRSLEELFYDIQSELHLNDEDFKRIAEMYGDRVDKIIQRIDKLNNLNEAAMSDQEVYRVVLGWYKQQIESGKMTLNQCYELLSDKAKVSLNKMVNQNKIKESIMNRTIHKLIKESIKLNKGDTNGKENR